MSHEIRTPLNTMVGLSEDIATYEGQVPKEVVEDTENIRNASQTLLEIVGNILDINKIESNKMKIIEKINAGNTYDLILMDIMMSEMSGSTALAKLKENPNFNTPVIALTADAVTGAKEKYISEGFVDYIAKPFSKDQIKEKLDMIFNDKDTTLV